MTFPDAADDGTTPRPTSVWRVYPDGLVRHHREPGKHPRAAYWRQYRRRKSRTATTSRSGVGCDELLDADNQSEKQS